ncbi:unnamed protein product [Musa acuminata subsp. malaccensis]|uniref:(wild Malaysian banana) hypothetical protein n=1 Tax=Musa acuminata subsp. malaccensis TaxID=214687 RepID=A0A8D7FB71_MUSAM|nr:unnamed protein product [Musa acuminata subsp. malaccensis]
MGQEGEATAPVVAVVEEEEIGRGRGGGGGGGERGGTGEESCDYCGAARALLWCRADAARLCLACDRHVHAANSVSSRHRRALLCDACRSEPSAIHCSSCRALLCANCDFDAHGRAGLLHDRRPVEGFSGCPSAGKLVSALGVGGDEKEVLEGEADDVGDYLVEDGSVWEAQPVLSFEDFIVPTTASHGFQAMGMPPLPKHRNSTCGKHKEEIIQQIRDLIKLESGTNDYHEVVAPIMESYGWVSEQNIQIDYLGPASNNSWNVGPASNNSWNVTTPHEDITLEGNQIDCREANTTIGLLNPPGEYPRTSSAVNLSSLNKAAEANACKSHGNDTNTDHVEFVPQDEMQHLPLKGIYKLARADRNSVILRYQEKRKTRNRYNKLIRYESRKIRADSRLRIKGRFAKTNPSQ